jgi:hypothetical protein
MKHSQILWKKLLSAALVGAVAVAPIMGNSSIAQADSHHNQSGYRDNNSGNSSRNNGDARKENNPQDRSQNKSPQNNQQNYQSSRNHAPHANDPQVNGNPPHQDYHPNPSRDQHDNYSHVTNTSHVTFQFHDNHSQDDNWHRSHGYVQNGSRWYWHDHDDGWWIDNGYYWNGLLWVIAANSSNNDYGPFQNFTGIVTHIDYNDNEFDIRINDNSYNVYPVRDLPERLSVGDIVQVHGQRFGNNDIRNSDFTFMDN